MSRKSKINPIEKVKTVEQYLNGEIGIRQAGKELGVAYQSIQKWVSIYKSKGPVGLLDQSQNNHYSKELKQSAATTAREIKSNYCSVSLHSFLITGIDSQSGKIRLINPTPRKRSEGIIELSKYAFNKYCFILSGILGKEFSL